MLLRDVEVDGARVDARVAGGFVTEIGTGLGGDDPRPTEIDAGGAALIPGLHDHHIHLLATAAARESVPAGPPEVRTWNDLANALQRAPTRDGWIRAVGYDESVAGALDRHVLDTVCGRPLRIQHRSGALWTVNSAGAAFLGLDDTGAKHPGVERDSAGRVTGRLWRADAWLAERLGQPREPNLARLGAELAATGITGVTDATPSMSADTASLLAEAHLDHRIPQRVTLLAADLPAVPPGLALGPAKIVVADHHLPGFDELAEQIGNARRRQRAVAVHCVTREALLLALSALAHAGAAVGDRIEHAAVAPPEAIGLAAELGVTVVTQPSLVARRGDDYLDRVADDDRAHLWPWRSLTRQGVPVAGSSDAPYGDIDPWASIHAAVTRVTPSGRCLGAHEQVSPTTALKGWLTPAQAPGGWPRRIKPGAPADLVLLDAPLAEVLAEPDRRHVALTMVDGRVVHDTIGAKAVP